MTVLTRDYFDVHIEIPGDVEPTTVVHRVCYAHADRLRAELEANARKIPREAAYNTTSLGLWCALRREGKFDGSYETFCAQLINWEAITMPQLHGLPETVDPTQPAADTASRSSSPAVTPESTGSTPTSTNA